MKKLGGVKTGLFAASQGSCGEDESLKRQLEEMDFSASS